MKWIHFVLFMMVFLLFCAGCSGSNLTGKVMDAVTGNPVEVKISAITNTHLAEEPKQAKLHTVTSKDGSFTFKGCLANREYVIKVNDTNYLHNPVFVTTPDNRRTREIPEIQVIKKPNRNGVFTWDSKLNDWRELDHNYVLKAEKTSIRPKSPANAVMDIYLPMAMDRDKIYISDLIEGENFSDTGIYYGQYSQIGKLEKAYQFNPSTILAFQGEYFKNYEIMGLFYYPAIGIYDKYKMYPGTFDFAEGYHAGIRSVRGSGKCCRYLDVKREYDIRYVRDIAEKKIGGILLYSAKFPVYTYNVLLASGKLELQQGQDADRLQTDGIPAVVFTLNQ